MIIYLILIILCLLCHYLFFKRKKNITFFLITFLIFIISAVRYNVGTDYIHYSKIYFWIINNYNIYVEIGYKYFNELIYFIFNDVRYIYIISSLLIVFSFYKAIKDNVDKKYWFFSLFLFITSGILFSSFNLIRQYMAIAIIVGNIKWLVDKNYFKFILTVLIASTFHTSALIVIPFIVFVILSRNLKTNKLLWIIYFISIFFLFIDIRNFIEFFSFLIPNRWINYLTSEFLTERNVSAIAKQVIPNIIAFYLINNRYKLIKNNSKNNVYILGYLFAVLLTNLFYGILVLVRFAYYFEPFLLFVIPIIIDGFKKKNNRMIITWLIIIYYLLLTIVTIFIMNGNDVVPYVSWLGSV